jgi:hypothetical protein
MSTGANSPGTSCSPIARKTFRSLRTLNLGSANPSQTFLDLFEIREVTRVGTNGAVTNCAFAIDDVGGTPAHAFEPQELLVQES